MSTRFTSAKHRPHWTFDSELEIKDASTQGEAADGVWQVDSANKIINVGNGRFNGVAVVDVSAMEIASGDERYDLQIQGSLSATFADDIVTLASLPVGDGSTISAAYGTNGTTEDDAAGRYEIYFCNERNNIYYPYIRGFTNVVGSIGSGGIVFKAFIAKTY